MKKVPDTRNHAKEGRLAEVTCEKGGGGGGGGAQCKSER